MTNKHQVVEVSSQYMAEAAGQAVPVGYKQTDVGVIPENWEVVTLAKVCKEIGDGIHATPVYSATGEYYFINGNNISNGKVVFDDSTKRVDEIEFSKHQKKLSSNTILLSINGTIGNLAYFNSEPLVLGKSAAYLDVKDNYSKEFVYYILQTTSTKKSFEDGLTGTTIKNLGLSTIRQTLVVAPQRPEQTAIANALSDVDALINELEKLIAKKQAIKTATMQQLLTGRTRLPPFALREDGTQKGYKQSELGEIPEDWALANLGDVCVFENGDRSSNYPSPNSFVEDGIPFINAGHVANGVINLKQMNYIKREAYDRLGGGKIRPRDILFCLRGSLGKYGVVSESFGEGAIASSLVIVRPKSGLISLQYLANCYMASVLCQKMIQLWAGGAAQPNLGASEMAKFLLPLPVEKEQTAIATILSDMDTDIQTLQQRLNKTRQIKQGMMQELLTGRIRLVS